MARLAGCTLMRWSTSTRQVQASTSCSRYVTSRLWMMPTRCAPTSLEANSPFRFPGGIGRSARSRWFVSMATSGSSRKTSSPARRSCASFNALASGLFGTRSGRWHFDRRVHHLDGLNRYISTEAQPALGHRRIAHLRATLVGLGRPIVARGRLLHPEPGEEVGLRLVVELQALLRLLPQELALEPLELMLQCIVLRLQLLECTPSSRAPHTNHSAQRRAARSPPQSLATSSADTGKRPFALNTPAISPLSTHSGNLPVALPLADHFNIDAFQPRHLRRAIQLPFPLLRTPTQRQPTLLEALAPSPVPARVERNNLQQRATAIDEHEPLTARRLLARRPPYPGRQSIE